MSETVLDVQGLTCPLPVLKANKALRAMAAGARLTVLATDPASVKDFQAYARETGHALVGFSEGAGLYRFTLRKREAPAAATGPVPAADGATVPDARSQDEARGPGDAPEPRPARQGRP